MKKKETKVEEEEASPYPIMRLAQDMHRLTISKDADLEVRVFQEIAEELENPSLYRLLREKLYADTLPPVKLTEDDLKVMEEKNKEKLVELKKAIEEAVESAGDMEVMDAHLALARFAAKSLSESEVLGYYQEVLDLPKISSNKKIDSLLASARISSFYSDTTKSDDFLEQAQKIAGDNADWDRRNRLKVYSALQKLLHRDLEAASKLLLECIATFSSGELCEYNDFVVYAVLTNILHLSRPDLKEKIVDGPEIISVAKDIPVVIKLVRSLYDCDYKAYLHALVDVENVLLRDRYLQPHSTYWMREFHVLAYKQYLDSYQSVTISAMSASFGVSQAFIDHHASRMIASGHLSAKIDKVNNVIVTARPDTKNAKYREIIQKGDALLNRIQKLARVVDI